MIARRSRQSGPALGTLAVRCCGVASASAIGVLVVMALGIGVIPVIGALVWLLAGLALGAGIAAVGLGIAALVVHGIGRRGPARETALGILAVALVLGVVLTVWNSSHWLWPIAGLAVLIASVLGDIRDDRERRTGLANIQVPSPVSPPDLE